MIVKMKHGEGWKQTLPQCAHLANEPLKKLITFVNKVNNMNFALKPRAKDPAVSWVVWKLKLNNMHGD